MGWSKSSSSSRWWWCSRCCYLAMICSVPIVVGYCVFGGSVDFKGTVACIRQVSSDQRFLFLLSNLIIASLIVKSGLLNPSAAPGIDLYEEFIRRSSNSGRCYYYSDLENRRRLRFRRSKSEVPARRQHRRLQRAATTGSSQNAPSDEHEKENIPHETENLRGKHEQENMPLIGGNIPDAEQKQWSNNVDCGGNCDCDSAVGNSKKACKEDTNESGGNDNGVLEGDKEDKNPNHINSMSDEELNKRFEAFIATMQSNILRERQESFARRKRLFAL
eukprot:TRINITY_DN16013_c0_g1_i1.p1 TRINITY_DN16013_c0_g1~~TRINITY_DN16013_c0_g1_i1.p1  ORF type:complete len:275 (-),score=19.61 TRINITY_DN16013_c0_g1_i1:74-898(-)